MSHNITPNDVMPEGNASMPSDAPTVAVVVSLNIPQMTDEVAGEQVMFISEQLSA